MSLVVARAYRVEWFSLGHSLVRLQVGGIWTVGPPDLGTQKTLVIMFWSLKPGGHFCGVIIMSGQWSRCPERKVVMVVMVVLFQLAGDVSQAGGGAGRLWLGNQVM